MSTPRRQFLRTMASLATVAGWCPVVQSRSPGATARRYRAAVIGHTVYESEHTRSRVSFPLTDRTHPLTRF